MHPPQRVPDKLVGKVSQVLAVVALEQKRSPSKTSTRAGTRAVLSRPQLALRMAWTAYTHPYSTRRPPIPYAMSDLTVAAKDKIFKFITEQKPPASWAVNNPFPWVQNTQIPRHASGILAYISNSIVVCNDNEQVVVRVGAGSARHHGCTEPP